MPALRVELVAEEGRTAEDVPALQKPILEQAKAEGIIMKWTVNISKVVYALGLIWLINATHEANMDWPVLIVGSILIVFGSIE